MPSSKRSIFAKFRGLFTKRDSNRLPPCYSSTDTLSNAPLALANKKDSGLLPPAVQVIILKQEMNALKRELEVERKIRRSREGHVTDAEIQLEIDQAYHRFKSMPDYAMEWLLRCEDYKSLANAQTSNLYTLKEKNLGMQRIEVEIGHLEWMAKDL